MRWTISIFILFFCTPVLAQAPPQDKTTPSLEAITSVLEQHDCIDDSGMAADGRQVVSVRVDLVLKVQYKNTGLIPLIIHTSSGTVGGERIALTIEDAQKEQYSYKTSKLIMFQSVAGNGKVFTPPKDDSPLPSKQFVVIKPDDFYENQSRVRLFIRLPEEYRKYEDQTCQLQLALWTMGGSWGQTNNSEEVRTRWQPYGYLWTKGVTSQPMAIRFPSRSAMGKCNPK
jgi:hypothetical protein